MLQFHVYVLRCSDGSYYVGHTDNLEERLFQHENGTLGGYTARRRPVRLVWSHELPTREQAFELEQRLKSWSRAKKEALIREDFVALKKAARGKNARERVPRLRLP